MTAGGLSYLDVLAAHARHIPRTVATVDERGETTFGELWRATEAVAVGLLAAGIGVGDRVVTAMVPGTRHLAVLLATMRAGAVAVPLNTRLTSAEARTFLGPLEPSLIVADEFFAELTSALAPLPVVILPPSGGDLDAQLGPLWSVSELPATLSGQRAAIIFGTGGTTGLPKGAAWSHAALWLYCASCQSNMDIRRTDVELYFSPFFHVALVTVLFSVLYAGGSVWMLPRFSEDTVLEALHTGRPTRMFGAPTALMRVVRDPACDPDRQSSVRRVLFGSARSEPGLPASLRAAFPRTQLVTGYGATEFGAVTRLRSWEMRDGADLGVGRPVPGVVIDIADPDGRSMPRGATGEVTVYTPWRMLGYWGRPADVGGGVRSGDLGWLDDDGYLHLAGRAKDMVITGGENVYPVEVEDVLAAFPGVLQSAVFGRPDELWGERIEAAVVCTAALDIGALTTFCRERLAGYKVPRRFHVVSELPLTAAMKVDKRRLREDLADA
ncbi:MAG: class I adenylate-forming enzyme family protein [Betaproteobacteria bacterium]